MNWFHRPKPPNPTSANPGSAPAPGAIYHDLSPEDQANDLDALERGNLPTRVLHRIEATQAGERPWLSTLDIADWYLADGLHIMPLGHVTGSAYYHVATDSRGREYLDGDSNAGNLIRGYYASRDLAVGRLIQEAKGTHAHAVIDAQFKVTRQERVIEVSVVGTAIQWTGVREGKKIPVSPLSGEEFFKLAQIGWMPVGLALGYHWHVMPVGYRTRQISTSSYGQNQELSGVSQRFSLTREVATRMLRRDAAAMGANGVAGVHIDTHIEETEIMYTGGFPGQYMRIDNTNYLYEENGTVEVPAFNLEFYATGAAIRKIGEGPLTADAISHVIDAS
ncbi:MAG: heavy metal-binding domain-containing protein [Firmicutes bacterium]|jgi:uncharacterized protein YbjQ (UPF0145 family)|nr:heavy metal-binding domain-containing protein [Bacillota bacterium]MCL5063629.1 heavy metal-binding domain-containing protein [Bacillota bacterium]